MTQFISNIHGLMTNIFTGFLNSVATPANAQEVETLIASYLNTLVGSSVTGEIELSIAQPLMSDALSWIVQLRQKNLQIAAAAAASTSSAPADPVPQDATS